MTTKSPELIPVAGPSITDREIELVSEAAEKAWYSDHYAYNRRFEEMVARYVGVQHAVSLPHCTSALHLSLVASGIKAGDEVIVPDVTWIASVAPVVYVGAQPVFVDILKDTWCLDPDAVEKAIGPKTKAIVGVDLYGSLCDWGKLSELADAHGLVLIEDSAEALGSRMQGRQAGSFGHTGAFSFHGSKTVATGEGGMLVTDDDAILARVQMLRDHGRPPGDRLFLNEVVGFKYKMSAVTAALGIAQMERIDELIRHKRQIFRWYKERCQDLKGVALNAEQPGVESSFWMVTIVPDASYGLDKFELMARLRDRNIDTRPFFSPLSTLNAFADAQSSKRFVDPERDAGHRLARTGVNLPSGYNMTESMVDLTCQALCEVIGQP